MQGKNTSPHYWQTLQLNAGTYGSTQENTERRDKMLCREEKTVCGDVKDTACGHDANQNSKGRERDLGNVLYTYHKLQFLLPLPDCYTYHKLLHHKRFLAGWEAPFPPPFHINVTRMLKKNKTISQNRNTLYFTDEVALCFPEVRLASAMSPLLTPCRTSSGAHCTFVVAAKPCRFVLSKDLSVQCYSTPRVSHSHT